MRRVPILDDLPQWVAGEHPDAAKPLSAFHSITAICDACGHRAVLDRQALAQMTRVTNFAMLWQHAYCAPCRAEGATKTSVMLFPNGRPNASSQAGQPQRTNHARQAKRS